MISRFVKKTAMNELKIKLEEMSHDVREFKVNTERQKKLVNEINDEIEALLLRIRVSQN